MSLSGLRIEHTRLLPGCSVGLAERTAVAQIGYRGDAVLDEPAQARIRAGIAAMCPQEPLYRVGENDWPAAFLVDSADATPGAGEWIVALTIAVQRWARDPIWRGRVLESEPGRLRLAIPWLRAPLFNDALALAIQLIELWAAPAPDDAAIEERLAYLRRGLGPAQEAGLLPNTLRFIQAAVDRDIPFQVLPSCIQLGWGARAERLDSSFTGHTGHIAAVLAKNKFKASRTLADAGLPLPIGEVVATAEQAKTVAANLGWPVVVKPLNQDQGIGVVAGIGNDATLSRAFAAAERLSPGQVIVERHIAGNDYRLLVVAGKVLAAARRIPAAVTGDGERTVTQLVDATNADPRRGTTARSLLKSLVLDDDALDCLAGQGLTPDSVPAAGRWVPLLHKANISAGGTTVDVTAQVHPDNRMLAQRAARIVGLDIAGIDLLCPDISRSWRQTGGAICEVNAQPSFRVHWLADPGRDLNGEVLDGLFAQRPARIPTAAITGTNGKSTTAAMLHHIWLTAGKLAGVCTTSSVRIGTEIVSTENLSGLPGAAMILNDPGVEAAVLELPRKGLVIFGHPCDRYDVAALINVQDDHLGVEGIDSLEQMAQLKAEVLERAATAVVINADDPLCMAMRARAGTDRHVLVTREPDSPAVIEHRRAGGETVSIEQRDGARWIVLTDGASQTPIIPVDEIPATMNGLLRVNEINAMFATALAWVHGIDTEVIRASLGSFANSREQNPGRYNISDDLPFRVLLDYAHNPDGVQELCAVAAGLPVAGRRLLCCLNIGSRHRSHLELAAPALSAAFNDVIVGCDPQRVRSSTDYAGDDPVGTMLTSFREFLIAAGTPADQVHTEADPARAIRLAMDRAKPGDLVVLLAEPADAWPVIDGFVQTGG